MIKRGRLVGDIIDDLADIANQVETRCKLNMTDMNRYLEDFFKVVLNEILEINLVNLNQTRSNTPGLDLGDESAKIAFQITSQKTTAKIRKTLKNITDEQAKDYSQIKVLVIGSKQKKYSLHSNLPNKLTFSQEDIWDIDDLCKKVFDLSLGRLEKLHNYVTAEFDRVKTLLVIPDIEGHFPSTVSDYIEKPPSPNLGKFDKYYQFHQSKHREFELTPQEVWNDFERLSQELLQLPRSTREFYAFLLERKDPNSRRHVLGATPSFSFSYDRLLKICSYPDIQGEIRLLSESGFVDFNDPDYRTDSLYLRIFVVSESDNFLFDLVEYIEENKIDYHRPIVNLDFSDF